MGRRFDHWVAGRQILVLGNEFAMLANTAVDPNCAWAGIERGFIEHPEAKCRRLQTQELRSSMYVAIPENVSLYEYLGCKETGRSGNKLRKTQALYFSEISEIAMATVIIAAICKKPSVTYAGIIRSECRRECCLVRFAGQRDQRLDRPRKAGRHGDQGNGDYCAWDRISSDCYDRRSRDARSSCHGQGRRDSADP